MFNYKKHARVLFGFIIGMMAGMSLNATIYPAIVASVLGDAMDFYALYLALIQEQTMAFWGVCLGIVAWAPSNKLGLAVMGICGFVTSLYYGLVTFEGIAMMGVVAGVVISTTYGAVAGLLLAKVWTRNAEEA